MDRKSLLTITTTLLSLSLVISLCNDPNCAVCNSTGTNCDECKKGFTLRSNSCYACPSNCLTCTAVGYCQACSPGFWGSQCLFTCPDNCYEAGCEMVSGYCLKCKIGWYGQVCREECNRCENDQCELLNCTTGCKDGYFPDSRNGLTICIHCPLFCKKCSNAYLCTQCYTGYYINQYTVETIVVATCSSCSSIIPRCVDCTYNQYQVFCRSCEEGYVINQDNQCVTTVKCIYCQDGCDLEGRCSGGCEPGRTGPRCEYQCSDACKTCNNQDVCLSCKEGFYTQTCNVPCNTNCQSRNSPRCRFVDGYCSNGCNKGFWGDQCENNCNNNCFDVTTASELCHRNGTCYYGCRAGYMGSDCSQVSSTSSSLISSTPTTRESTAKLEDVTTSATTTQKQTKTDMDATEAYLQTVSDCRGSLGPAIGGSIAGGFVLGALVTAVMFYLRGWISQKQKDRRQSKNMYYNVSMAASHEEYSPSDNNRQLGRNDIEFPSVSRQSEVTIYEKLSERNKGNVYDHLEQPSENEVRQDVGKFGSHIEYYNN